MGFLWFRPQDLKELISMNDAMDVVEKGYRETSDLCGHDASLLRTTLHLEYVYV